MHTHTNAHVSEPASRPLSPWLFVPRDKAGFYVRKRLMLEPGALSEPQRPRCALYMLKPLKDVKKYPLFGCRTLPR